MFRTNLDKTKRKFQKYNLVYDDQGLIRSNGRLNKTELPDQLKKPILLPGEHPLIRLLALHYHRFLLHQGYKVVLSYLSTIVVIIGGGTNLLKRIASKCIFC